MIPANQTSREERTDLIVSASRLPTDQPYTCGLIATVVAWLCGAVAAVGLIHLCGFHLDRQLAVAIALGSGVVATAASVPGVAQERRIGWAYANAAAPAHLAIGFSAGVLIRLLGTVALLGLCSYHMPAAKEQIAGWTLAWYVYLTTVDVTALAMLLPRQDGRFEREAK